MSDPSPMAGARPELEQRKLVTVLFADLVDFTVISQRLDVEDVHEIVDGYFNRWRAIIEEHGGVVEKFIGDAVMAVFGMVRSAEDDAHRAVRAAIAMRASMADVNAEYAAPLGIELRMRVGIDTGEVVTSRLESDRDDFVVVGEIVNRASRLQGQAPVGAVLVSADTFRLVRGSFHLRPVGALTLKGYDQTVDAYLVEDERPTPFRLDAARGVEGIETRTVGRAAELARLRDLYADVTEEHRWRVVTVVGDAGVGKSRLVHELTHWLDGLDQPVWWFTGGAGPERTQPFAVLHDMFARRFDVSDTDDPSAVRDKWEAGLRRAGDHPDVARDAVVIGRWLGFELGSVDVPADPQVLHARAVAALGGYLRRLAALAPVVIALEDLHWADEATLSLIDAAGQVLADLPVLVLATTRPALFERHPHWGEGLEHHVRLEVGALSRRETRELIREILRHVDDLPTALVDLVLDAAEGNPFYVEELLSRLIETGVVTAGGERWTVSSQRLAETAVPSSLRSVLQARLDDLPLDDRDVLARAAVVGRVFWDDAVVALAESAGDPAGPLARLRSRELVHQRERSTFEGASEFWFKHALLRDVTYDSLLRRRRQALHGRAARWYQSMAERSGRGDELAGVIARHLEGAGDRPAAARWLLRAGHRALGVHGLADARALLTHGLALVGTADAELRFDLLLAGEEVLDRLGERPAQADALRELEAMVIEDPGREVRRLIARCRWAFHHSDYERTAELARTARSVADDAGLAAQTTEAELWLGKGLAWAGRHDEARRALETARLGAEAVGSSRMTTEALRYLSIVASNRSEFPEAERLLGEAIAIHRREGDTDGESLQRAQLASVLFNAGRFAEARGHLEAAMPDIAASGIRYREAIVVANLGTIVLQFGEYGYARRLIERGLELAIELEDAEGTATALGIWGDLDRRVGAWASAHERLAASVAAAPAEGHELVISDSRVGLALVARHEGDLPAALRHSEAAIADAERADSALARARALVARGYVLTDADRPAEAAASVEAARELAVGLDLGFLVTEADALLARLALSAGDEEAARAAAARAHAGLAADGLLAALAPGEIYLAVRDVFSALGDERASDAATQGRRFLRDVADAIDEPDLRESFLTAVPAHRRLGEGTAAT